MKEKFQDIKFKSGTLDMINKANAIISELRRAGYTLTLRQLYYQLVSRDVIPNKQTEYKRLGSILNDARLAGLVDWSAIEDRTRNLESVGHWDTPSSIIDTCARSFKTDKWANQPNRVEVWVEKDALVGVLGKACRALDVAWFSCRGYTSQSELYVAAKRLAEYDAAGQHPVIIHLGDHDPSGIDMTRDITDRLTLLSGIEIEVDRIALNMEQISHYKPPPNPAKITDSRFAGYEAAHGSKSWELDALSPQIIDALITVTVERYRDDEYWEEALEAEAKHVELLKEASGRWDEIADFLSA